MLLPLPFGTKYCHGCFFAWASLPCCQVQVQQVRLLVWSGPRCCLNPAGCDLGLRRDEVCSELHTNTHRNNEHYQSFTSISRTCLQCKAVFLCLYACVDIGIHKHTQRWLQEWFWEFFLGGRCCSFIFFILQCSNLHPRVLALTAIQHLMQTDRANISRGELNLFTETPNATNLKYNRMQRTPKWFRLIHYWVRFAGLRTKTQHNNQQLKLQVKQMFPFSNST